MSINISDILPIVNGPATGSLREHLITALGRVNPGKIRIATAYLTPNGFIGTEGPNGENRQRPIAAGRAAIPEPKRSARCARQAQR